MRIITYFSWQSLALFLSLTPCFGIDSTISAETSSIKGTPTVIQHPTNCDDFFPVKGTNLTSSERINVLLVEGSFGTLTFHHPLAFHTSQGLTISTPVIQITVGRSPTFANYLTKDVVSNNSSNTHKFFQNRTQLKSWLEYIANEKH